MELILIGGGEHAAVVFEAASLQKPEPWKVIGFVAPEDGESEIGGKCPRLGDDGDIPRLMKEHPDARLICALGKNEARPNIVSELDLEPDRWATVIHPEASVSDSATICEGSVVLRRAILQPGVKVGRHCIINTGSIIEHDTIIGDFSHIAPGVVTGGGVITGKSCLIGLGAKIRDHISIGDNVTVGTGSVVVTDIGSDETVAGVPARRLSAKTAKLDIHDLCISPETTLFDAMSLIGKSGTAALVTDPGMHLLGLLNDGDIRKALLGKKDLNTPVSEVMNTKFKFVRQNVPRVAVLDTLNALGHTHMPVLDDDGRVVAIHTMNEMIGSMILPNIAVIMAGGKGVRLKPITDKIPKPMVKVAGRPILEHIILHLAGSSIRDIFISVNYLGDMIKEYFQDGSTYGVRIRYLHEDTPLGTGGALGLLPKIPDSPLIVMNGDLVTQFDVGRMLDRHHRGPFMMTVGVHDYRVDIPYGVIHWNEAEGRVDGVSEKPEEHYLVNAGVYVVAPEILSLVEPGRDMPMTDLVEKTIANGMKVGAHLLEGDWIDIGHHRELAAARGL